MRHLVVAHHDEALTWLGWMARMSKPWSVTVVSNGTHRPNTGREAGAYLWWIDRNWERLHPHDVYAFVQADPFPHCADIVNRLHDEPGGWQPLGDHLYASDANGGPHHHGLPVAEHYERITGAPFPAEGITFYAGGQWMARGAVLKSRPRSFYAELAELADWEEPSPSGVSIGGAWVLERLWAEVFHRTAASHHTVSAVR